ncbi:MAG: hypothetical protein NTW25_14710 [Candidatus Kapabacteria bacterium]|nr:hypothetical protein [Candidatus Kapabacteria bacterium]
MKKMLLVLLFGMFFVLNISKAETLIEFQNRCRDKPNSLFAPIPISYGGCEGLIYVCLSRIGAPGSYTYNIEYYSILATTFPCNLLSYNNLINANFWSSIDQQVIDWSSINGYAPAPCGSTNLITYYQISKRPCQKIINYGSPTGNDLNAPLVYQKLVPCGGLENTCTTLFTVCYTMVNGSYSNQVTKISTTMTGNINCSTTIPNTTEQFVWNSEGQYFDILFDHTQNWETECFSMGCN